MKKLIAFALLGMTAGLVQCMDGSSDDEFLPGVTVPTFKNTGQDIINGTLSDEDEEFLSDCTLSEDEQERIRKEHQGVPSSLVAILEEVSTQAVPLDAMILIQAQRILGDLAKKEVDICKNIATHIKKKRSIIARDITRLGLSTKKAILLTAALKKYNLKDNLFIV